MSDSTPNTIYLKDYQVPDYLIESVALEFILNADNTQVSSALNIKRNPASQTKNPPLILAGEQLTLLSVRLNDVLLNSNQYQLTDEQLIITALPQNTDFTLQIENSINPAENHAYEGLYVSNDMLCTQCEAEGFRKITYFLDRPDVMCRFTTTLKADKSLYPVLLSNGNKIAHGDADNNMHWVTWEDPFKKPCYLFALVAGQLDCIKDQFTTMSGRSIDLQIYVESHDIDKCDHAMQSLKKSMLWDEQRYGREYDLDLYMIVAVGHFNMGAMENKGLNIFNTKFVLARPDTATDMDYEHIEAVIAHEYFHNWTGNRITCRDWFQLSLKEGFTVFRDQEFTADQTSHAVKRIEDVNMLRTRQFAEDAGPLSHSIRPDAYIEINNFYTLTVYEKGAEIIRMLRTILGEVGFHKGADLYFQRHDGEAVTCEDFIAAMADANNKDLSQFSRWYSQAGTPTVYVTQTYNKAQQQLVLNLSQTILTQENPQVLQIPIKTALFSNTGECLHPEVCLELTEKSQDFVFDNIHSQPIVSILRNFSAPIKLVIDQPLSELAHLLQYDTDSFNRWEAGQQLSTAVIFDLVTAIQQQQSLAVSDILINSFATLLKQDWQDLSYFTCLLSLPTENFLAEQIDEVDVTAIHQARLYLKQTLAEHFKTEFTTLYQKNHQNETGELNPKAMAQRSLKNLCLDYLNSLNTESSYQRAQQQFDTAHTMTDQIAALSAIVNSNHPDKAAALNSFYQQWQHEALVIDKWFTLQASSQQENTLQTVKQLLNHSAFNLKNPNRVRALIGAFSQANPYHFHQENGDGYQFLTEQILALNSLNPQVASRMVGALTHWQRFNNHRQHLMLAQLEKIVQHDAISKDVFEIATKSLAAQKQ